MTGLTKIMEKPEEIWLKPGKPYYHREPIVYNAVPHPDCKPEHILEGDVLKRAIVRERSRFISSDDRDRVRAPQDRGKAKLLKTKFFKERECLRMMGFTKEVLCPGRTFCC